MLDSICNTKYIYYPYIGGFFILVLICIYIFKLKKNLITNFGILCVLFGGIRNIIEWLTQGCVLDHISFFNLSLYNINDLLIVIGSSILLGFYLYDK